MKALSYQRFSAPQSRPLDRVFVSQLKSGYTRSEETESRAVGGFLLPIACRRLTNQAVTRRLPDGYAAPAAAAGWKGSS